ncbi:NACHT domain-containing protein [Sphaerisporangium aureirubrum]|uniref:NACHT domain-containing protein n=1 Tax=Sphaerisporangium aureirubrum TaxID=1544736 RepID=A0ABW1NQL5_9ACTN
MNRRGSWLAVLVAALLLAAVGVLVMFVVWAVAWNEKPNVADVVEVAFAAAALGGGVMGWARNAAAPKATRPEQVMAAKGTLAGLVRTQWRAESMIRSLEPDPIPVLWQLTEDTGLMDHPHLVGEGALGGTGNAVSRIAGDFMKLRRRRLVIIGDAGTGKTTLAIQLLLELTEPGRDLADPVPVLLSLSGWDTTRDPDLHSWLAKSLERDYPALRAPDFGSGMALELVAGGHILPILDGMDELPAPARAEIVRALNGSLDAAEAFILTSRTKELKEAVEEAGRPLPSAAVIAPEPLTRAAAERYLRTCLPPSPGPVWGKVLSGLRTGKLEALSQLAGTPLGLWLLRAIYITPRADPAPLTGKLGHDAGELRAHLWDGLIPVLLAARPPGDPPAGRSGSRDLRPRRAWDPAQTRAYLSHLARVLSEHGTRDLAWWRLGLQELSDVQRRQAAMGTWLAVGVIFGLVAMVAEISPLVGMPAGLASGVGVWTSIRLGFTGTPGRVSIQLRGRLTDLARQLTLTLLIRLGLVVSGVVGVALLAKADPWLAVKAGMWASLTLGPVLVFIDWMQQPTPVTAPTTPYQVWRASRTLAIVCAVLPGVAAGVTAGLVGGLANGPGFGIRQGLLSGVFVGLAFGLSMLRHNAWPAYETTARHLAARGECPRNLMVFLDDAYRLGLLRVVGPVYQFRHADLQDHLAGRTGPGRAT